MTRRLVTLLEHRGCDPRKVCARANLPFEELQDPAARVPYEVADGFVEACVDELGTEGLSVALAGVFDETTYDAAGLALLSSPTLGEGLVRAFAYQRLWGDGDRFTLERDVLEGSHAVIRFRHPGPSRVAAAVLGELALLETMSAVRMLVDPTARPIAVRFTHAPPATTTLLAGSFGTEPVFGASDNELVLESRLLDAPVRTPEGAFGRVVDGLARRALAGLPASASVSARVRAVVNEDPSAYSLGVADIARRFHMSGRTLQRRLRGEGTSWAEIVDVLRRRHARELSRAGVSDKEIAFILGFADASALVRARVRWRRNEASSK